MASPFQKQAESFLQGTGGKRIQEKKAELEKLSRSADGQKVKAAMEKDGRLQRAVETGDPAAMQSALAELLSSREGKRLAQQLQDLMK